MTAIVVFLNTGYDPPEKVKMHLAFIQEQLELYHAELAYKSREMSEGEKYLYKKNSHKAVRDSWRLYQGIE